MSMTEKLAAIRSAFESSGIAPDKLRVLDEHATWLGSSGAAARAAAVGSAAPPFDLLASDGRRVSLGDELAAGPCVLTWFRGSW